MDAPGVTDSPVRLRMDRPLAPSHDEGNRSRQLFDVKAACEYLQSIGATGATISSTRTIFAQVRRLRIGKRDYVSRESLDSWIANRQRKPR